MLTFCHKNIRNRTMLWYIFTHRLSKEDVHLLRQQLNISNIQQLSWVIEDFTSSFTVTIHVFSRNFKETSTFCKSKKADFFLLLSSSSSFSIWGAFIWIDVFWMRISSTCEQNWCDVTEITNHLVCVLKMSIFIRWFGFKRHFNAYLDRRLTKSRQSLGFKWNENSKILRKPTALDFFVVTCTIKRKSCIKKTLPNYHHSSMNFKQNVPLKENQDKFCGGSVID